MHVKCFALSVSIQFNITIIYMYTEQKRNFTLLNRHLTNLTQTHYLKKYAYIKAIRLTRQPC